MVVRTGLHSGTYRFTANIALEVRTVSINEYAFSLATIPNHSLDHIVLFHTGSISETNRLIQLFIHDNSVDHTGSLSGPYRFTLWIIHDNSMNHT